MRLWIFGIACSLCVTWLPSPASAQVVWDAPSLMRPGAPSGLSVLLIEAHPSNELGVLAAWRGSPAPVGLGLRGGLAEDFRGDLAALFGVDISGSLATLEGAGDPGVLWWTGAGLGVGDDVIISFPLGLVLGWQAREESITFMPYVGGHATLDVFTGPGDDIDLDASVDLGLDMGFGSQFMVRFGVTIGGRDALGIGVRLPG
ncbi:MAG TPA: hypothetical protein VMM35_04960 [Longimicrobiales bacterium]|nr:hypothetical protein [Longimicrobiales bacterium]